MTAGESTVPGVELLFAGNLPESATEASLHRLFETVGPVESVRMPVGRNGRSKHVAYVQYRSQDDVVRAMSELKDRDIDGRPLRISVARSLESYQAKKKEEEEKRKEKYLRSSREDSPSRFSPPLYHRDSYMPPPPYDRYYDRYRPDYRIPPPPDYGRWPPPPEYPYDGKRRRLEDLLHDYIDRKSRHKSVSDIIQKIRDL